MLPANPEAWLLPAETGLSPIRPENRWRRWIGPKLEEVGHGWVNFQVLRRTHASLAHAAGIDPKVRADQMGNGIGVNLDEYTVTALDQRTAAVELLEAPVLHLWSVGVFRRSTNRT
jgi:integrase